MRSIAIMATLLILVSCANAIKTKPIESSFILSNVNIVEPLEQKINLNKTIIVADGKIVLITDNNIPSKYEYLNKIDGSGGFITPGLIDMHVHMYEAAAYQFTLSHGVTHVRIMNGIPAQLKWREQVSTGELIGSSSTVSSPILSGYENAYLHHAILNAEEARDAVRQYHAAGYDLIKAYGNLNEEALVAIIEQSNLLNMPVAKHGPHGSGNMSLDALVGMQSLEHVEDIYQGTLGYQFKPNRLPQAAKALNKISVPVTPTLNIFYQLTQLSVDKEQYLQSSSPEYTSDIIALEAKHNQLSRWLTASDKMAAHNQRTMGFLIHITKVLHENDVELLVGSDSGVLMSPHGIATHTEMMLLREAGLNSFEVIAAATVNPAKALNLDDHIGQIKEQYQADFIYTLENPIKDLSVLKQPKAVAKVGRWLDDKMLNDMRAKAIDSRSIWGELSVLFDAI